MNNFNKLCFAILISVASLTGIIYSAAPHHINYYVLIIDRINLTDGAPTPHIFDLHIGDSWNDVTEAFLMLNEFPPLQYRVNINLLNLEVQDYPYYNHDNENPGLIFENDSADEIDIDHLLAVQEPLDCGLYDFLETLEALAFYPRERILILEALY